MKKLIGLLFVALMLTTYGLGEPVNQFCLVTPEEQIDQSLTVEYKGVEIGFCCKSCLKKFNENPEVYFQKLPAEYGNTVHSDHSEENDQDHDHSDHDGIAESGSHDHVTDHSDAKSGLFSELINFLGKIHVLVIHFPIALIIMSVAFEVFGSILDSPKLITAGRYNYLVGAVTSIMAVVLGWMAAWNSSYYGELADILVRHKMLGTIIGVIATCGLLSLAAEHLECKWGAGLYRTILITLVILLPITAHWGGTLIYGVGYFSH